MYDSNRGTGGQVSRTGGSAAVRGTTSVCAFHLAGRLFGLDTAIIGEVVHVERIAQVPQAPSAVLGLFNLRGAVLTLIDLATLLQLPSYGSAAARGSEGPRVALILNAETPSLALQIEKMETVVSVTPSDLKRSIEVTEHPAVTGFIEVRKGDRVEVVTMFDAGKIPEMLDRIRFRRTHE